MKISPYALFSLLTLFLVTAALSPRLASADHDSTIKPALVYSLNSHNEKKDAFLLMSEAGVAKAHEDLGIDSAQFKRPKDQDILKYIAGIAQQGYSPIIAVGSQHVLPILNLADQFPNTKFTIVDGIVPPLFNNVQSVTFKDHEGSFLVGMVAAYTSKTKKLGFIGGMDIPLIRNFGLGFMQGAKFVNPLIEVDFDMVGSTYDAWSQPEIAYELAQAQYDKGIDIIFAAAGASTLGALDAAKERELLAIGVDSNQNGIHPGYVLSSMVKRVDKVVYETLQNAKEGKWKPGIKKMGLKEHALDYAVDTHNRKFMNEGLIEQVETAKEKIITGLIRVEEYSPE